MTEELKLEIVAALEAWMKERPTVSQNDIAIGADVNAGYLINMRKKVFAVKTGSKDVILHDKYFLRLAKFIGFEVSINHWETKHTIQLKDVLTSLSVAKENSETTVIIGETGSGKTFSVDAFKSKYPTEVFSIKVGSSDNLPDILEKILDALRVPVKMFRTSSRLGQIALRLKIIKEQGLFPMLIFDEAEYMKYASLCAFKELYDVLHKECALVLIGTDELVTNIERLVRTKKPGVAQLYRRIKFKIHHLQPIDRRFEHFLNDVDQPLKRWLQENCENYGELHDVMVPALKEAERSGDPLTIELVKTVLGI